jgi:LuxR family maltose regulon positive regulatory protein
MSATEVVEAGSLPILSTKLLVPPHRDDVIARPRLTGRLTEGLSGKLTLVSAPPGFGKTTLVTEWLMGGDVHRVGWIGLDPGDNDPGRFLTYLVSAIRSVEPDFGPGLINLLQSSIGNDPSLVMVDLINALSRLSERVVVVLDDFHVITDEGVHRALAYLVDHQPPSVHIVVTSRVGLPIPLSLLRTRRELCELRADDLRFTIDEATSFLSDVMGLDLPPEQIAALDRRAEGWVVGLLLAALAAQDAGQPDAAVDLFSGEHRYLFDYLAEEVLRRQPPDVQDFLERTSVLEQICADLAAALGATGCQEMLEHLVTSNLFTQPLDGKRHWYRYHQLFGEFLSARFRESDPEGWTTAHARASDWYFEHGFRLEAVDHALAVGDQQRLIKLVETVGLDLVRFGRIPTITRWLAALPAEVVTERPALALLMAWATLLSRQFDDAALWLERVNLERVTDPERADRLRISLAVCRATYGRFLGDVDEIIRLSAAALDLFQAQSMPFDRSAAVALLHLGSAVRMRGDTLRSIEVLSQAVDLAKTHGGHIVELNGTSQLAYAYGELGEFEQAETWAREALRHEQEYGLRRLGMCEAARITLVFSLREREDFEAALQHLDDTLSTEVAASDVDDLRERIVALHELAMINVAKGDAGAALAVMDDPALRSRDLDARPGAWLWVAGLRARIHLFLGRAEPAIEWGKGVDFPADTPIRYLHEQAAITRAWVDIELGRPEAAERLLTRLVAGLSEAGRAYRLAEARLLLAVVLQRQGRQSEADELIDLAIGWANRHGFRRVLIDTHPDVHRLLLAARRRALRAGRDWLDFLDATLGSYGERESGGAQSELVEPLSERELEVLALLQEGISNREIAERLFLSVGTVKRHTHNLYGKLEVSNRTQAIIRGQELGLLERS